MIYPDEAIFMDEVLGETLSTYRKYIFPIDLIILIQHLYWSYIRPEENDGVLFVSCIEEEYDSWFTSESRLIR